MLSEVKIHSTVADYLGFYLANIRHPDDALNRSWYQYVHLFEHEVLPVVCFSTWEASD